ncbi:MAG TPA: FtsW/RodA/SpoVE family cell cycle protein [Pseudogracilibacillus sp.]|nr:FtsW/RodA/SpoVE family cell cycle protein [Pseudogracilibacillus sp.]
MNKLKNYDFLLMILPILLAAFGIVMIYSASMYTAVFNGFESTYYAVKQAQWFVLGIIAFIVGSLVPYRVYHKFVIPLIIISFISLIIVQLFGQAQYNAVRSFSLFGINIQPSEFIKVFIIIYLASVYSKKQAYINDLKKGVIPPLLMSLSLVGLIIMQPDLGSASIILGIISVIVLSSGIRFKHIFLIILAGAGFITLLLPWLTTSTRINRFTGAYDPFSDPTEAGYHLIQSYLAISGGGVKGEGLGQSIQKLGYLWGAHTDFIMAVIAEELGVIGVVFVIGSLLILILRGLHFAKRCNDSFGTLLAIGISSMIGFQAIVNLGAISGVLPITGVTLPFISYGGSSLVFILFSMGILNNIAKQVKKEDNKPKVIHTDPVDEIMHRRGTRWSM